MKKFYPFAMQDFRQIVRDRMLSLFLLIPFIQFFFLLVVVPIAAARFPIISSYLVHINAFGALQVSIMFGFISGFILLEEKDTEVLQALRVLPITASQFLLYRLGILTLIAIAFSFIVIQCSGLAPTDHLTAMILAVQYGFCVPLVMLLVVVFAKNKVEGMAFFKGINLILLVPMVTLLIPGWWNFLLSPIPIYWTFQAYVNAYQGDPHVGYLVGGVLAYTIVIYLLTRRFSYTSWQVGM